MMDFKKRLKQRLYIGIGYLIAGAAFVVTALITKTPNYFISTFGITLLILGAIRVIAHFCITKDDQTLRQRERKETDERNIMIAEKARSWAFSYSMLGSGIIVLILSLLGKHEAALPFAWYVCGMLVLYLLCYGIIRKKY